MTREIDKAVKALCAGKPVVFPTDTVYGLGVSVEHARTPQAIYYIKQRAADKPIAWLVGGPEALDIYGADVSDQARELANTHWPGALTIIVKASDRVPKAFQSSAGTIGLRMPANDTVLALIKAAASPIATTSANLSGKEPAKTATELDSELVKLVEVVVVDDDGQVGLPSTVVDCTSDRLIVLRNGAVNVG